MSSLLGKQISSTYPGLIKTNDEAAISATPKQLQDGSGNNLPVSVGTTSMLYTGTQDFSGATVVGIGGGGAGLVSGAGTESMRSSDGLTVLPAQANGNNGIALGSNARANADSGISIGEGSNSGGFATAVGKQTLAPGAQAVALGFANNASGANSIAIGRISSATSDCIAIGNTTQSTASNGIAIGTEARSRAVDSINIGRKSVVDDAIRVETVTIGSNGAGDTKSAQYSVAIGSRAFAVGAYSVALGHTAATAGDGGIAIGNNTIANLANSVALGRGVTAVWSNGTTVNLLAIASYASLDFANDAAAAGAGVPLGGVYHTSGALKIRIV